MHPRRNPVQQARAGTDRQTGADTGRQAAVKTGQWAGVGVGSWVGGEAGGSLRADTVVVWWQYAGSDPRAQARELLRAAAADAVGADPADVRVGRAASGAPKLSGAARGLLVGLSHTRGLVTVAVAGPRTRALGVGVDAEAIRPLDAIALAERWFTADEAAWVRALPPTLRSTGLLDLWTRKEAVGKAFGTGLRAGGLRRRVGVPPPGAPPASPRPLTPLPGAHRLMGTVLSGPRGYVLACAIRGAGTPSPPVQVAERIVVPGTGPLRQAWASSCR
jgi:4'-phosphopantetheinyl transferase